MEKKYYLALFSEKTWTEFLLSKKKVYGTVKQKIYRANKLNIGDYLICYILRKSLFVGVLQVNSNVFYQESKIWEDTVFPVQFKVKIICEVPTEKGLLAPKMFDKLSIFKRNTNKKRWGVFFMNSFNEFPEEDGKFLYNELSKLENK